MDQDAQSSEHPPAKVNGDDVNHPCGACIRGSLFMFSNVQSWILDGSWCCLWTDADRKIRSRRGLLKISLTSFLFHRCGTKADSFSCGPAAVATWVARVREGLERRTIVCLNMESERDGAPKIRSPPPVYRQRTNRNVPVGGMCMYITEKCVCTQNKAGGSKKPLSDLLRDQCHECSSHPTKN